jgi:hypothetical protein
MQQSMQQLDIFADSRDVVLRNDVVEQLQRRDAVHARASLTQLANEYPDDSALPAMTVLVCELENESSLPLTDHAELASVRRHLEDEVMPAAQQVLPAQDLHAWSTSCWRSLAERAAPLAFCAIHTESHAAPLWLRAGGWAAATDAVNTIESWWRIPSPSPGWPKRGVERPASMRRGHCLQSWRGWHRHGSPHWLPGFGTLRWMRCVGASMLTFPVLAK